MVLCIAEKPSVGKELAKVLKANTAKDGYMEGNGYWVSWTFGHLCTLFEPQDYTDDWKQWRMEFLPMYPPKYKLKLKDNKGVKKQFETLERLIKACEKVINCGDAGQEGELIQRWVMQKAGCKVPVQRLWISALTEEAIKDGFSKLYDSKDFDALYAAGSARAIGDWLLGMNATRAYTLKYANRGQIISIGRVQTPTLALLVERQKAINNFKPQKYWEIKTVYRGGVFSCDVEKILEEEAATKVCKKLSACDIKITKVEKKKGKEAPPKLFDLTLLQVESNKKYGFSAEEGLALAQSLYEKKLLSYPRVDTNFLPNTIYAKVPKILEGLVPYRHLTSKIEMPLKKSSKIFNDKKITDHHAIIPTGEWAAAASLSINEKRLLDMVVMRFIAAFYPDCEFASTNVEAEVVVEGGGEAFAEGVAVSAGDSEAGGLGLWAEPSAGAASSGAGGGSALASSDPNGGDNSGNADTNREADVQKSEVYKFKASGKQILSLGWKELFPTKAAKDAEGAAANGGGAASDGVSTATSSGDGAKTAEAEAGGAAETSAASGSDQNASEQNENEENKLLPDYKKGESGRHEPFILEKQTTAPKYMTEGDLLRAMETAGKQVDNEELRALMKENGIGRPSTRAAIIETLIKRGYIKKEKKRIVPTSLGMNLIDIIPDELLKSAELTGVWEKKLRQISNGEYNVADFMKELKEMVFKTVSSVKNSPRHILNTDV